MRGTGVIKLGGESKAALVVGQMNEPPGARARVAFTGLTIAEHFREESGKDVLLFIDNIFRFSQAGSEVSAMLGRIPSAVGYQPTLANEMGALQERITTEGPLLRYKLFTYQLMIFLILLLRLLFHTWMRLLY